jgi:type VI secretion system secreted protein VgrG
MDTVSRLKIEAVFAGLDGGATVHAVRGREEVSRPFRYQVDFEASEIAIEELRGSRANLSIDSPRFGARALSGIVSRLELLASDAAVERYRYRAELVPLHSLLDFRHGFRIFQEASVPDVVKKVIESAGLPGARFDLGDSYPKRDYCVQYDETEWQFVCRLLEEEGIWFRFEQGADGETLVISDASARAQRSDPPSLAFVGDPSLHGERLRAWALVQRSRASVAGVLLDDYDFVRPSLDLRNEARAGDGHGSWFEYPARALEPSATKRLARARLDELRAGRRTVRFATDALGLQAGQRVEIADHPHASGEYFVTAVSMHLRLEEETGEGPLVDGGPAEAWMEVEGISATSPFRPRRVTPRPLVAGPQTARVTGAAGEEIHCDPHGRVKLQFHWDPDGELNDKSSAWIRVAQSHTTGSLMIPRVGWEVLVDFLEGDPDRPVCTGRLFNPLFPPPYDLPGQKTVTAVRSNASPGGAGANELQFDDAPGAQRVLLNAHHDLQILSAEKTKVRVGKMHDVTVVKNNTEKVSAGDEVSVKSTQSASVGGGQTIAAGTRSIEVGGDCAEEVKGSYKLEVGGIETIKVGNPLKALVQLAATEAIEQASALAASAATNAAQAILSPLRPALDGIAKAAGALPKLPGSAAGLLGSNPAGALPLPPAASKALALADPAQMDEAISSAVTGAAAAAAPAVAAAIDKAMGGGSGTAGLTVGGDLDVEIGAVEVVNAVGGISLAVGGSSKETVGAARLELAGGGRVETTTGNKNEIVGGAYVVSTGEGIAVDAGANLAVNVGGFMKQNIGGDHTLTAEGPAALTTRKLKLEADESITLKCGKAEVVLNSDGVSMKGLMIIVEGSEKIDLEPPAIGPG